MKRWMMALISFLTALICAGCAESALTPGKVGTFTKESAPALMSSMPKPQGMTLNFFGVENGFLTSGDVGYTIREHEPYSGFVYLHYFDFIHMEGGVLCRRAGCAHAGAGCGAAVPRGYITRLLPSEEGVWLLCQFTQYEAFCAPTAVYVEYIDYVTGARTMYPRLNNGGAGLSSALWPVMVTDGRMLFVDAPAEDGWSGAVCLDLSTGEQTQYESSRRSTLVAGCKQGLLCMRGPLEGEGRIPPLPGGWELFLQPYDGAEPRTLATWEGMCRKVFYWEDFCYLVESSSEGQACSVERVDITAGTSEPFAQIPCRRGGHAQCFEGVYDGKLVWSEALGTADHQEPETARYALDLQTGEVFACLLPVRNDSTQTASIHAESREWFVICTAVELRRMGGYGTDGMLHVQERPVPVYSLIRKEDYWSNIPEYVESAPLQEFADAQIFCS